MRYLEALLESLETTGPVKKSKPNNFKLLKTLVDRGKSADKAGDKLDNKYIRRHTKTGRGASDDKQQDQTLKKLSATGKEAEKSFTQADKLVPKVHLKGGGKGDGKPRGKLRLVQSAFYQQVGHLIAEIGDAAELDMGSAENTIKRGDRWYKWLKKNMRTAPRRKVSKAEAKLRTAGKNADKALSKAATSIARRDDFLSGGGQKLV